MEIVKANIEEYVTHLPAENDPVLQKMEALAVKEDFPIVGPLVGRLCSQLVKMVNAKRIFELGSGFGYSAYWMAKALPDGGNIICTEWSAENIQRAKRFFQETSLENKVEFHQGDALEILEKHDGQFDIIFNDIHKELYPVSLEIIVPRLRPGGVLITDNLLWDGLVLTENPDETTECILEYTKQIYASPELYTTIIPFRDGVGVSLKRLC